MENDTPPSSQASGVANVKPERRHAHRHRRRKAIRMRPNQDDEPQYVCSVVSIIPSRLSLNSDYIHVLIWNRDWWFAAMAIPMLAATTGPLANMFSIAAIVTPWRNTIPDNGAGRDADSVGYPDPRWYV